MKENPVAHELSILEEEEVQQHRKSLPHSSPDQSNKFADELQSETSLLAVETIFFESDPTVQVQESSKHVEGRMGLIDIGSSDEQGGADDVMIDGSEFNDVFLKVVINQHAEDD